MKEISLHLLDVAQNSVSAGAGQIDLVLEEDGTGCCRMVVADDGRGMSPEFLASVTDPFTTTRTTRKVGLGLPLLRLTAEQTGGRLDIQSQEGVGTTVTALLHTDHIDCPPLGDLPSTVSLLIQGAPQVEWTWRHSTPKGSAQLDTRELRQVLGPEVPLNEPSVALWIQEYLQEQEEQL
jgi:hypothetical protein